MTTPGRHVVKAKIDWCSSPEVMVELNEHEAKQLKVGGFKHGNWLMPFGIAVIVVHFLLKMTTGFYWFIFLMAPTLVAMLYYLTIGRKKFLTLGEVALTS